MHPFWTVLPGDARAASRRLSTDEGTRSDAPAVDRHGYARPEHDRTASDGMIAATQVGVVSIPLSGGGSPPREEAG